MKKIVAIVVLLGLFSCSEKEVQLPQAEVSVLKDIVDHSPIYMFFEIQNKKASLKEISEEIDQEKLMKAVNACPVKAISFSADEY